MLKNQLLNNDHGHYTMPAATTIQGTNLNMFMELPEMIFVETRFIKQQEAAHLHAETTNLMDTSIKMKRDAPRVATPSTTPPENSPVSTAIVPTGSHSPQLPIAVKKPMTEMGINTDSPNPLRDREQQTDSIEKKTACIAIQCNMKQELECQRQNTLCGVDLDDEGPSAQLIMEKFKEFLDEHTQLLTSGMQECLICGEIGANANKLQTHMAFHWGPPVLCCRCGRQLENKILLRRHNCEMQPKRKGKLFKCPHYRCRVATISRLELYDHINEHTGLRSYRCYGCKLTFTTYGELRHHLALRHKCLEAASAQHSPYRRFKNKRDLVCRKRVVRIYSSTKKYVIVKKFLSTIFSTSRSNLRCQLCQKRFFNFFQFGKHNKRCLKRFLHRLRRKSLITTEESAVKLSNGHCSSMEIL